MKGARKGQIIDVTIHDMTHDELGYTALWPGMGIFPDWVRQKEFGIQTRVMRVNNGFVHWSDTIKLPIKPMVGVMGVAPVLGAVPTVDNGPHGGNLDVQEMTIGSTTSFVVNEDGAALYIGDCHALQGDGECAGMGALEIATNVTFSVALRDKPARMTWPRIETETYIATLGCARPLEDAMRTAFEQMVYWLADSYGFSEADAYHLSRADRRGALHADGQSEIHLYLQSAEGVSTRPLHISAKPIKAWCAPESVLS